MSTLMFCIELKYVNEIENVCQIFEMAQTKNKSIQHDDGTEKDARENELESKREKSVYNNQYNRLAY